MGDPNLETKAKLLHSHERETLMLKLLPIFQTISTKLRKIKGIGTEYNKVPRYKALCKVLYSFSLSYHLILTYALTALPSRNDT